ncbi:olfactory receptor 6E1-like [Odontesthes bonariensis]
MEDLKPMYFCIFLIIYLIIIVENVLLIEVIHHEKSLHEPMYVLLCNLAVNELYGSTALLPALLVNILSPLHEISLSFCQIQIFAVHTYAITEFTILAVMSYDRYVAICHPLSYHAIMSQRIAKLIVFMWLYPVLGFLIVFIFTLRLPYCGRIIEKVYCVNYLLVKLACTDTSLVNIIGLLFSPTERNYDVGDRELLTIKLAMEEWRHWLEGTEYPVQIWTDHKNLSYLQSAKRLNPRQSRCPPNRARSQYWPTE